MKYVFVFLILVLFIICVKQHKQINTLKVVTQQKIDSLQNAVDSIHAENYPCQIELSRYESALNTFMDRNPEAAKQYGTIISEETE